MKADDTINKMTDLSQKGVAQMSTLSNLNLNVLERLAALQVSTMNLAVEHNTRIAKLATESKDVVDFFKGQVDASKDLGERLMSMSKENLELANQINEQYRSWFEKSVAELNPAPAATPPAK